MTQNFRAVVRGHTLAFELEEAISELAGQLGDDPLGCLIVFAAPRFDLTRLAEGLKARVQADRIIGCTTAGEIGPDGYVEDSIVILGLKRSHFVVETVLIEGLDNLNTRLMAHQTLQARQATAAAEPDWEDDFAFLLVDGLSQREDQLVSAIMPALGAMQLFGGSAGDKLDFGTTKVLHDTHALSDAAVLTFVRTRCDFRVFRYDNFLPTETCMVVTDADPVNRIVKEINGEPAALEYARLVGKDPNQLTPMTFASHPVVVRMGAEHHVRAIQRIDENSNDLCFFSAIEEGLVLRVADSHKITEHLDEALTDLAAEREPDMIMACDCMLRKLDAEQQQATRAVSNVLARHRVVGFSTYGEQYNGQHVNQTFTGVAIYAPDDALDAGS